jgi:alkaline phosphatase D
MDDLGLIWLQENPHMEFHNSQRGYMRCELALTSWRSDYKGVPYISRPGAPIQTAGSIYLEAGAPGIAQVEQ